MTPFDPEEFLNRKHYASNFQALIGDVEDFLEFSEYNIEWQYRTEVQAIRRRTQPDDYPDGYLEHLLTNAEHRFMVSLPMRLRYAALVALITTVEWQTKFLAKCATFPIGKAPRNTNPTVHILRQLNKAASLGREAEIEDYARLVVVRNVIVHSSGVERDYVDRKMLNASIKKLKGFSIGAWHAWVGDCVRIERGALTPYIRSMSRLLLEAYEKADQQGLLAT